MVRGGLWLMIVWVLIPCAGVWWGQKYDGMSENVSGQVFPSLITMTFSACRRHTLYKSLLIQGPKLPIDLAESCILSWNYASALSVTAVHGSSCPYVIQQKNQEEK